MTRTQQILKFQLRSPFMVGAFSSREEYREFSKLLSKKRQDPSNVAIWDYSGYGTILGDLIQNFNHVLFVGEKYDFILNGFEYVEFLEGIDGSKKWKNYMTERFTCNTDVESAGSAITAIEYMGSFVFEYVVVYKSLVKHG